MEKEIKLMSININGLNSAIKRFFSKLEKLKLDIICLQEVHIKKQHDKILDYSKNGKLYTSLAQQSKREVFYIKDTIKAKQIFQGDEGKVEIMINCKQTLLVRYMHQMRIKKNFTINYPKK
uniref:Endonuclease/exonuclease/phosphatase domain-containing protein n=1 Tax=Micrurus paraensis TaxID=1970185 RepID=A0A2D4JTV8_9SAUR